MPVSGTFDTMQLSDLIQWIYGSKRSGCLTISLDIEEIYLEFRDNKLIAIGSDDPLRLDLGQVLVARGMLQEGDLRQVLTQGGSTNLPQALVQSGRFSQSQLARMQIEHAFETVLDLFFQDEGSFHFSTTSQANLSHNLLGPPELPQTAYLQEPIDIQELIFEGMKRIDEWNHIRVVFPNSYVLVQSRGEASGDPIWELLQKIGFPISIGELCLRVRRSRFETYKALFESYRKGLIVLDQLPGGQQESAHVGPVAVLLDNPRVLISEQQFDEAREVLATASNLDPTNPEVRALLKQCREAQLEHLYEQIPPHRVPRLVVSAEYLNKLQLSPREMYLASRLTERWDVATLVIANPLGELETLRILRKFLHAGICRFME